MGMAIVMAYTISTSEYTADDLAIVATTWLYLILSCSTFQEVVYILYPMRNVLVIVATKDMNVKDVAM